MMYCTDYVECYRGYEIYAVRGGYIAQRGSDSIDEIDLSALHRRIDKRLENERIMKLAGFDDE